METHTILQYTVVLLAAAAVAVPIAKRFELGAVLGYLIAGAVIGPAGFKLLQNPEQIAHISELGVVLPATQSGHRAPRCPQASGRLAGLVQYRGG